VGLARDQHDPRGQRTSRLERDHRIGPARDVCNRNDPHLAPQATVSLSDTDARRLRAHVVMIQPVAALPQIPARSCVSRAAAMLAIQRLDQGAPRRLLR
jgi:hypothetical protein